MDDVIEQPTSDMAHAPSSGLVLARQTPLSQHPAAVYLARLGWAGWGRTMRAALNVIAVLLGVPESRDDPGRDVTYLHCDWAALRYAHTAALRARLVERYEPATANVKLAALRGV